jgi:vacuolar-type H+-ATPase subunit H
LENTRDPILQDLIDHEKSVAAKVEEARAEAERIVAQAVSDARDTVERARREGDAIAQKSVERAQQEADDARSAILAAAREAVASIEAHAARRRDRAVAAVVEQVLP